VKEEAKFYHIITYPVGEPGEAKRLWLFDLQPQNAGKLLNRSRGVGSVKL